MDHNGGYGTSWAEQWDYGQERTPATTRSGGSGKSKTSAALEKTKAVAATGLKKVKQGTTVGAQWIKEKYNNYKRNGKH
ncbi:hypothetical protein Taro_045872 [Colocasia esculenta]|uniref:Uncharacterized protein n=1 Tax=Colocasia esculenta TaxID=4460 RepID=A0A843X6W9_COLES|nr:hypothetical protein [Colocasia esculenta]